MKKIAAFVLLCMLIGIFLPQVFQYFRPPTGTVYEFADGYIPDYYQYLSWIKSGMDGHVLLSSRYVNAPHPAALVHPLFSITGNIAGFFLLSPPIAYLLLRLVALLIFFFTLYQFIKTLFPGIYDRIIGLLFILFGTGFETIPWSGHFSIISKYSLPPHHLLALAAWMGLLMVFAKRNITISILLGWCLALLNPSIFLFTLVFLTSGLILSFFFSPKLQALNPKPFSPPLFVFLIGVSPVVFYNLYSIHTVPPWSIMYVRMLHFNPPTTFTSYLLSLGPFLVISLIGVWKLRKNLSFIHIILLSWAYLPIALFPFVGIIPINYSRLFQTYQYIPITVLAVYGLHVFKKSIRTLLIVLLIFYGSIAYVATLQPQLLPHDLSYYNVFVPKSLLAAFRFLDGLPTERIVVSGEYVSQMIPAFTKHRTLIGRDDIIVDYYPLRDRVFAFLDGRMTEEEARRFVEEQKVDYVIFGVDTKPLSDLPTKNYRFLVPVFTNGLVTVVQIKQ